MSLNLQNSRPFREDREGQPAVHRPEVELHAAQRQVRTQRGRRAQEGRSAASDSDQVFEKR